jgi:hypothetical protein
MIVIFFCLLFSFIAGCCEQWRMISLPPIVNADFALNATQKKSLTPGQTGVLDFNVTSDVSNALADISCGGISWLLKKDCEQDPGQATFYSGEGGNCPKLKIFVQASCPLPAPPPPRKFLM